MKHKLQNLLKHNWRTLLLLLTLITISQGVWAWFTPSHRIYFDASVVKTKWGLTSSTKFYCQMYYGNDKSASNTAEMTLVSGSDYLYYTDNFTSHDNVSAVRFYVDGDTYGMNKKALDGWQHFSDALSNCCWDVNSTSSNKVDFHDCKTPPLTTVSLDKYNTTTYGGTGTSDDPYRVVAGTTIQVQASSTKADNSMSAWYNFKVNSGEYGSYSTTSTKQVFASAVAGTNYSAKVKGKGCDSNSSSSNISVNSLESSTVHFKTVYSPYVIKGLDSWEGMKEFNSSGNYTYTATSNGYVEFKLYNGTWYGNGKKMLLGVSHTISGNDGICKLYVQNGITYTFHYDGKDASDNPQITITPSAQSVSSNIYIKGPLRDASCWDGGYDNTAFDKEGSGNVVFTKIISAKNSSCDGASGEFTLSASTSSEDNNILNGRYIFVADGETPAWSYSDRSGAETNFKYTSSYSANDNLLITVTWDNTNKRYKMKVAPSCPTATQYAVSKSPDTSICQGAEVTITLADSDNGYVYKLLQNGVETGDPKSGIGSELSWTVNPSETTTTYGVIAWEDGCENTKTEMSNTVTVTVKGDMAISAEKTSGITPYEPVEVTVTGTSVSNITLSAGSDGAALYDTTTKLTTTTTTTGTAVNFKAPAGTHTVTVTATDAGCTKERSVEITVGADSEDC